MSVSIFDRPPATHPRDYRALADQWIAAHPVAFGLFERFALDYAATGHRFGMKAIAERVRWECVVELGTDFKINNDYTAYIARRLVERHPEIRSLIEMRRTKDEGDD